MICVRTNSGLSWPSILRTIFQPSRLSSWNTCTKITAKRTWAKNKTTTMLTENCPIPLHWPAAYTAACVESCFFLIHSVLTKLEMSSAPKIWSGPKKIRCGTLSLGWQVQLVYKIWNLYSFSHPKDISGGIKLKNVSLDPNCASFMDDFHKQAGTSYGQPAVRTFKFPLRRYKKRCKMVIGKFAIFCTFGLEMHLTGTPKIGVFADTTT